LGLEQSKSVQLSAEIANLSSLVGALTQENEDLGRRMSDVARQSTMDREQIQTQLLTMASLQEDISALRQVRDDLENRIGVLARNLQLSKSEAGALRDRSKALVARLADEREITMLAQKEIDSSEIRIQALNAIVGQQKKNIEEERILSASARSELALLNQQLSNLKKQLTEISLALAGVEKIKTDQAAQIKDLGKRLNIALARQVNKLARYRSEFFGRLREVLGDNPNIRIEGDRFVLQAELLFASGSADLGDDGKVHLAKLAATLQELSAKIPGDINWILRIDGHADRIPIHNRAFASNWELSTARAVSVVRYLAGHNIPQKRMAATGFSEFHPLDAADTAEAFRKNRRIEIKLTSR
ncbi:MAG: peptidoglycan -binding protein, partial [Deltaproteobacteria bacterium]|nr:peptidoglycan -binding protein [Deltaproteobacteria bacterium]